VTRDTLVGALLFAVVAVAACKASRRDDLSSSPPPPAAAPSRPQGPETGVYADRVVLGEPAAFSGPSAGLGIEMWRGASAAFEAANARGGVHGRRIDLVVRDDGYDAEKAAPAVVQLVVEDHAFAIFGGVGTPTIVRALPVVKKYYADSGLFYFANFTGAQPQRQPPYFEVVFNVRASYYEETRAIVDGLVTARRSKVGTYVQDDAYGTDGRAGVERALKARGLALIADTRYPRGQTYDVSTASQIKILRDAGVDVVVMVGSYQACAAFVRDARLSGWMVPIGGVSFVGADQMLRLLQAEEKSTGRKIIDNLVNTQVVPHYVDESVPVVREYREAIQKYHPTAPAQFANSGYRSTMEFTFGSLEGYVDAKAFLAILEATGQALTRRTFYSAAEHMGPFDLGLNAPAELSAQRHQVLDKVWWTVATPEGWRPIDVPGPLLHGPEGGPL
jgi:branched-chain amino acid transport system substrate-binding protein